MFDANHLDDAGVPRARPAEVAHLQDIIQDSLSVFYNPTWDSWARPALEAIMILPPAVVNPVDDAPVSPIVPNTAAGAAAELPTTPLRSSPAVTFSTSSVAVSGVSGSPLKRSLPADDEADSPSPARKLARTDPPSLNVPVGSFPEAITREFYLRLRAKRVESAWLKAARAQGVFVRRPPVRLFFSPVSLD
jgi:hypothetical protein